MKKKVLFVGDAACQSGFARATHEIIEGLLPEYDVTVLGINYRGDPHMYPYPIYAAAPGGDSFGINRLLWMCAQVQPDVIVIQQDGWWIPFYIQQLRKKKPNGEYAFPQFAAIPVVAAVAVDGKNFKGSWIKDVTMAIFWTEFALKEARDGGYHGPAQVIPLGVDMNTFYPVEKEVALANQGLPPDFKDKFVIGNVNRNQPRKRWDLTIQYVAEWVHSRKIQNAQLFLHAAPTGDESVAVTDLIRYYGLGHMTALCEPLAFYGKHDEDMRDTYNCFDVNISTTQGEGMGLTTMEAMACGVPCIVPDWSALGDWAKGAAMLIPCTSTCLQSMFMNTGLSDNVSVIGGVADKKAFIAALDTVYNDEHHRKTIADLGFARASEARFRWAHIGQQWLCTLNNVLNPAGQASKIWQEV